MSENLSKLAAILDDVAGVPAESVKPEASFSEDLELDSLTMVEVVVACEDAFGVRIPDGDVEGLKTVGDALSYIENAKATAGA